MIKSFKQFVNEEISGTEIPSGPGGSFGPAFGETRLQNKTISSFDTEVIQSIDGKIYSIGEYNQLYHEYLKSGGKPLMGFSKENLDLIVSFLGDH